MHTRIALKDARRANNNRNLKFDHCKKNPRQFPLLNEPDWKQSNLPSLLSERAMHTLIALEDALR